MNFYLQGSDIIMCTNHKPLQKILNGKNTNNKVNRWSLELATYNITFKWISGAQNKAADCLSQLVEVPWNNATATSILINSVTASPTDEPTTHNHSKTKASMEATPPDTTKINAPPYLTGDCQDTLLQMQRTDPFCKQISKWLLNGKAPHNEVDTFTHVNNWLYKHAMDTT